MIEKWDLREVNSRKALLIKGDFKDILNIVKKIGPVLSRPERILKGDYNFIMYILDPVSVTKEKITQAIEYINSGLSRKKADEKDVSLNVDVQPSVSTEQNVSPKEDNVDIPMPDLEVKTEKKEIKKGESNRIIPKGPAIPKSASVRIKRENIEKEAAAEEENKRESEEKKKITAPPSPNISQRSLDRLKLRWSIELPLNPTLSFQTLITGSHNRFAHAAAMAVVENPGVMYNPILIWGSMGSGKSHFIHSMSYGLSSTMGQKNIFVTNGVKFSVGVTIAIKEGFIDSIDELIKNSKVIIVDDIHLMLVNQENKDFISKAISNCMSSNKQVVFSSLFSPKELEPLEAMLGIEISQGWMVDIKPPNPQTYRVILNQILTNMDVRLNEEQIKKFFVAKSLDFRTVNVILYRMKKLEKYISSVNPSLMHADLLEMLFGESDDVSSVTPEELKGANFYSSSEPDSFYKWGVFYPRGLKEYVRYVYYKLQQVSSKVINLDLKWYTIFEEEYDPDEIYGIPFKIGNKVLEKNVNGVIILGPPPTSALSAKESEFKHLVEKINESLNVKTAWIYSSKFKAQSNYLNAIIELI